MPQYAGILGFVLAVGEDYLDQFAMRFFRSIGRSQVLVGKGQGGGKVLVEARQGQIREAIGYGKPEFAAQLVPFDLELL